MSAPAVPGAVGAAAVVASATGAALFVLPVTRTYSTVSLVVEPLVTRSYTVSSRSPTRSTVGAYRSFTTNAPPEVDDAPVTSAFTSAENGPDCRPFTVDGMMPSRPA